MLPQRVGEGAVNVARRYTPPANVRTVGLWDLVKGARQIPSKQMARLTLPGVDVPGSSGPTIYCAGDVSLAQRRCVAIVGARKVSADGARRAARLARDLIAAGVVVVSGLAEGVDTAAHQATLEAGGKTIAVIGTPLDKAYPAQNAELQQRIYEEHLLLSPFAFGQKIGRWAFPERNKIMAALTDATVIIEASDTSGSLHQAAECQPSRLNRPLFIARSVIDNPRLTWPARFLNAPNAHILDDVDDILQVLK